MTQKKEPAAGKASARRAADGDDAPATPEQLVLPLFLRTQEDATSAAAERADRLAPAAEHLVDILENARSRKGKPVCSQQLIKPGDIASSPACSAPTHQATDGLLETGINLHVGDPVLDRNALAGSSAGATVMSASNVGFIPASDHEATVSPQRLSGLTRLKRKDARRRRYIRSIKAWKTIRTAHDWRTGQ